MIEYCRKVERMEIAAFEPNSHFYYRENGIEDMEDDI